MSFVRAGHDEVDGARDGINVPKRDRLERHKREPSEMKISTRAKTIGIDLAKNVFAIHGIDEHGNVAVRRELRRAQMLALFAKLEPCLIGMEASAGAHYWARELRKFGHDVRLMPASYVKAYVKRGKNDARDAEAICEAVTRPTMRFVPIKNEEQQSVLVLHRVRDLLVRQRTQTCNTLRALCGEFGVVAAKGWQGIASLKGVVAGEADHRIPALTKVALRPLAGHIEELSKQIAQLDREILLWHRAHETSLRLATIPGIGPITATALIASIGDASRFAKGRDLSAWIGLTPQSRSSGGKERLGSISKQGDRYLRRLLVQGAQSLRRARTDKPQNHAWAMRVEARRGAKVAAVAQANKTARIAWSIMTCGGVYRRPAENQASPA